MGIIKESKANPIISDTGEHFDSISQLAKHLHVWKTSISNRLKTDSFFEHNGVRYFLGTEMRMNKPLVVEKIVEVEKNRADEKEYQEFKTVKEVANVPFEQYDIKFSNRVTGERYAIALFSDAHIEETVNPNSVLGLNEYNVDIAETRILNYFNNLAICINKDKVDDLIFGSLGDTISGYIHDELAQTNGLSPIDAILKAQSLIYSGLKFLSENTKLKSIKFVGIVGNHSRISKKIQHNNHVQMSYEYLMYKNIETQCKLTKLPIEFYIPESEMAIVNTPDGKRYIMVHGEQIRGTGNGTVCGIYPALNRLAMKWDKTFKQDKLYLGHFHSCVSIPNATVNGSIIGFNSFSLSNGFPYERPAQQYELFDTNIGQLLTRQIYCD